MVDPQQDWEIVRLGYYNLGSMSPGGRCGCQCVESEKNMCFAKKKCRAHSSAGYILNERAYEAFMTPTRGDNDQIDVGLINKFTKPVYVAPALLHQPGYLKREKAGEYGFMKACLAKK